MPATLQRPVRRRRPRRAATVHAPALPPARVITTGLLTPPRLVGVPLSITLRSRPDDAPDDCAAKMATLALRAVTPHLRPNDEGDDAHDFITLGIQRALPRPPRFREFAIGLTYGYNAGSLEEHLDPGDCYRWSEDGPHKFKAPTVIIDTKDHCYLPVGELLLRIHAKDEALAEWLVGVFNSLPFSVAPKWWLGTVGQGYWYGEDDETYAKEEYEPAGGARSDDEKWTGPTRKQFDELIPAWVRDASPKLLDCHVTNLRMIARAAALGIRTADLFDMAGERIGPRHLRSTFIQCPYETVFLAWKPHDIITAAADEDKNMQAQSGCDTCAIGAVNARTIEQGKTALLDTYAQLTAMDTLLTSLRAYKKKHRLV